MLQGAGSSPPERPTRGLYQLRSDRGSQMDFNITSITSAQTAVSEGVAGTYAAPKPSSTPLEG